MSCKRELSSPGDPISEKRLKETSELQTNSPNMSVIKGLHPNPTDEILTPNSGKDCVDTIFTDILVKDDQTYLGLDVDDANAMDIWDQVFKLDRSKVFGVALIKNKDRTLSINYRLHKPVEINTEKLEFEFKIAGSIYKGKIVLPLGPPPKLGEPVDVSVKKTGFKLSDDEILQWLRLYGEVLGQLVYLPSTKVPNLKTDSLTVRMILKRHIPSLLPAFGRKMSVLYRGQPVLCGSCFEVGHLRAKCNKERIDWLTFVQDFMRLNIAPRNMLGRWADFVEERQ